MGRFSYFAMVLWLLATTSCIHLGQRLLTIQIELDGQVVFEGIRGVPDNLPVGKMWDVLGDVSFAAKTEESHRGELEGDITVRILHVDRVLAISTVKSLSLQPDKTASQWLLGKNDVDRIKRAASN